MTIYYDVSLVYFGPEHKLYGIAAIFCVILHTM